MKSLWITLGRNSQKAMMTLDRFSPLVLLSFWPNISQPSTCLPHALFGHLHFLAFRGTIIATLHSCSWKRLVDTHGIVNTQPTSILFLWNDIHCASLVCSLFSENFFLILYKSIVGSTCPCHIQSQSTFFGLATTRCKKPHLRIFRKEERKVTYATTTLEHSLVG